MKKITAFILPLLLIACDKKTEYQEIKFKACCGMEEKYGLMTLKISSDDVMLNVGGTDIKMTLQDTGNSRALNQHIGWMGVLPETNKELFVYGNYNTETKEMAIYSFAEDNHHYSIDLVFYVDLAGFTPPTESEKCIEEIQRLSSTSLKNVFIRKENKLCETRVKDDCHTESYFVVIDSSDAVNISQDWNPEDFVEYSFAKEQKYKTEPCEALSNLKKYIEEHKSESEIIFYQEDKLCNTNGQDIYFNCDTDDGKKFEYYKISRCDNGVQKLTEYHVYDGRVYNDNVQWLSVSQTENGTLYTTEYEHPTNIKDILYNNNSVVLSYTYTDKKPVVCSVGELTTQQLCARHIDKQVKQDSVAGTIEMEVRYNYDSKTQKHETKTVTLSAEQALSVSPNWDYVNGIKVYKYGTETHESDACNVHKRLEAMYDIIHSSLEGNK